MHSSQPSPDQQEQTEQEQTEQATTADPAESRGPQHNNLFFRLLIPLCGLFVVTILALIASVFSTSASPVFLFLTEQGGTIITVEVTCILLAVAIAMVVDRVQYLRHLKRQAEMGIAVDSQAQEKRASGHEQHSEGNPQAS